MKTTLELPDDLLLQAKLMAVERRTTLKAIIEIALRRDLAPTFDMANPDPEKFEMGSMGYLVIKRRPHTPPITNEMVRAIQESIDEEDTQRAMNPGAK